MDTLPLLTFANWIPEAIKDAAAQLHAELAVEEDPAEALKILSQLISDPRMKLVWDELYRKKRDNYQATEEFFHPACVTNASSAAVHRQRAGELRKKGGALNEGEATLLEAEAAIEESIGDPPTDPRWSEQDRAAQIFLFQACRNAIDIKPVFFSDLQAKKVKLQGVAKVLRKQSKILKTLGINAQARALNEVATVCDDEGSSTDPVPKIKSGDDPWIITRDRGDPKVRTFIADLSITTTSLFGNALYSTVATTTNSGGADGAGVTEFTGALALCYL